MPTLLEMWHMSDHELVSQQGLAHMQVEAILQTRLATRVSDSSNELRKSMETYAASKDALSKKVHRLNVILSWATVAGSIAAIAGAIVATLQLIQHLRG